MRGSLREIRRQAAGWLAGLGMGLVVYGADAPVAPRIFHARDFQAIGDGIADDRQALQALIDAALMTKGPVEVHLEPGRTYRLGGTGVWQDAALVVRGAHRFRLEGHGAGLLVANPEIGAIRVESGEEVTLRDFTVDYDPLPYAEGVIVAVDRVAGTFDLKVEGGLRNLMNSAFVNAKAKWGLTLRTGAGPAKYGPTAVFCEKWKPLAEGVWRFTTMRKEGDLIAEAGLVSGDRFVFMARNWSQACSSVRCRKITWEDVTIYAAPGLALFPYLCEDVVLRRCHVAVKPGSERLFSTNADGIHLRGSRGRALIEGCTFAGMADDSINVHSSAMPVVRVISPTSVEVQKHTYTVRKGDRLEIVDNATTSVRCVVTATEVEEKPDVWRIGFDSPVSGIRAGDGFTHADNLYNLSESASPLIIRHCHFQSHRGRDILLHSFDAVIEDNIFDNSEGWAVVFAYETSRWGEGPLQTGNILLRRNLFRGHGGVQPAILQQSLARKGGSTTLRWLRDLRIEDNRFENHGAPILKLVAAEDVRLERNSVTNAVPHAREKTDYTTINLANSGGVSVRDLELTDPSAHLQAAVYAGPDVTAGVSGLRIEHLRASIRPGAPLLQDQRGSSGGGRPSPR